ncbi:MAG: zinc ribbon domain-containing protein [Kiritimatiellae bacterium]|nr:zinc ribbon domain-containing protein [Kiritimatiellia bacterium]
MPLYEFYCSPCHTVFTFRSLRVDTVTVPDCPVCGGPLAREVSVFAHITRGRVEGAAPDGSGAVDRMEEVMARMGERVQALDDENADPREAVKVMREMAAAGGLGFRPEVCEALDRIEAGDDPEKVEEEFREVFETDNPFAEDGDEERGDVAVGGWWRKLHGPRRDPEWHEM